MRSSNADRAAVLAFEDDSVGGADNEDVGDGQQDGAGEQEQLIEALLTLARGQAGLSTREPFDLAELAGQVLRARRPEAELRGLDMHAALSAAPAAGDPRLAERLAANLVDNALNHNVAHGHADVATMTRDGKAVLTVVNSGPVVPPAEVDRLVRPFQRLGADRTGHRKGLGLGLSIVQAIAAAHGATLAIHPRPGGGLQAEVTFPAPPGGSQAPSITRTPRWLPGRDGKPAVAPSTAAKGHNREMV